MKFPIFSLIGLIALYMLIFRNTDINKNLAVNAWSINGQQEDTLPKKPQYVDIYTGKPIDIYYDADKHITINRATRTPVEFYINTSNWDTVFGIGQFVVNHLIVKDENGRYKLDENKVKMDGDELKIKDGDRKLKIDGEEFKLKNGELKIKQDFEDGELKVKKDSTKVKVEDDEMKVKKGDEKLKAEKNKVKSKKKKEKVKNEEEQ